MMRDPQHAREHGEAETAAGTRDDHQEELAANTTRYSASGPLPPVGADGGEHRHPVTASERAYEGIMDRLDDVHGPAIEEASRRYGIPEVEIRAIITQESKGKETANAGASQKDHGRHAASGLMQVTEDSWEAAQRSHPELARYSFAAYRYDPHVNILVGTAILASKREALEDLGIPAHSENMAALTTMAYNAGEGIVSEAYRLAKHAGEQHPDMECLKAQYLKPAIAKYPSVYSYYLTGGGKKANPGHSVQKAIDLKFHEISRYPDQVDMLIALDTGSGMAEGGDVEMPLEDKKELA